MAFSRMFDDQSNKGELAFPCLAKIEFNHADVPPALVFDGEQFDVRVLDQNLKRLGVHDQAREPEPGCANPAEQLAVRRDVWSIELAKSQNRPRGAWQWPLAHLEERDDGRQFTRGYGLVAHAHFAIGGRLIRIASTLPPVFNPKSVPLS